MTMHPSFCEFASLKSSMRRSGGASGGKTEDNRMRCYFDIFTGREIVRDLHGIEVSCVIDAITQARSAIAEVKHEENFQARFGGGALLLIRVASLSMLFVIEIDE